MGGIASVTLSDEEAKKRGTSKSILERQGPPTFDVAVEMQSRREWRVHLDVAAAVDALLGGAVPPVELREVRESGEVHVERLAEMVAAPPAAADLTMSPWDSQTGLFPELRPAPEASSLLDQALAEERRAEAVFDVADILTVFPFGVEVEVLRDCMRDLGLASQLKITKSFRNANVILALRSQIKGAPGTCSWGCSRPFAALPATEAGPSRGTDVMAMMHRPP